MKENLLILLTSKKVWTAVATAIATWLAAKNISVDPAVLGPFLGLGAALVVGIGWKDAATIKANSKVRAAELSAQAAEVAAKAKGEIEEDLDELMDDIAKLGSAVPLSKLKKAAAQLKDMGAAADIDVTGPLNQIRNLLQQKLPR